MCISRILTALDRYLSALRTDRGVIARKYLMGEYSGYDEDMTHVPEGCIYVEEWVKGNQMRRRIVYELEEITPYIGNPFDPVRRRWTWIGDVSTDVDITAAVEKYVMPGNEIRLDLVLMFLNCHDDMEIRYVDPASGEELLFPNSGVSINRYGPA
jgi:hypothetical protein